MSTQSAQERHADLNAAAEAAEVEWRELDAAYAVAAAAEHDALVAGDIAGSEQHRAEAAEHRQAALALAPRVEALRTARDEVAAEVAAEQQAARLAELRIERDQLASAFDNGAARYVAARDEAAREMVNLRYVDVALQEAERELHRHTAATEQVGGVILTNRAPTQSRLGQLLAAEADQHGAQIGPTLAYGQTRIPGRPSARGGL